MSHQVCHCGWSKVTTYQGLRTHQGMMGCTPKGKGIPESQQFIFNNYLPKPAYPGRPMAEEPLMNINTPAFKSDEKLHSSGSQRDIWWSLLAGVHQGDGGSFNRSTPGKTESGSGRLGAAALDVLVKDGAPPTTTAQELFGPNEKQKEKERQTQQLQKAGQLQSCHCGWSEVTTYHGLRTHQGKMGCTPKGMGIPESQQFIFNGSLPKPANPGPLMADEPLMNIFTPAFKSDEKLHSSGSQQDIWGVDQGDGGSFSRTTPVKTESGSVRLRAAALDALVKETNEWAFQTPPPCATTHQAPARQAPARQAPVRPCRALDFNTSAQQVTGQLFWAPPTTTAQETFGPNERQKERETQQLQKVRQDRTRADLQHDIQTRERKMAEVRSSVKACKGGLDAEWLEINDVFAGVMRAVEGARRKALGPLEERRKKVKKEAELLVQRLQKEIDKLKMTIDELETDPELKVSSQTGLTDTDAVNTSSSFGSLRTTTSNMMEEIHQELEKLSSVELKRISTFAVDVKLDPATAHPGLLLSPDGKSARDGGDHQKVPDGPQRFDVFGSVVGLGALPPGRSYWEVEVGDKTGWDLGVARRDARRKGRLSLDPANGYWVAVHFEGEKYAAMTAPPVRLPLTRRPRRVGVFVDRAEGLVSFYDAAAESHMYSFVGCAFGGEVLPYFSPHLRQNGENSGPLSLPAVAVVA